MSSTTCCGKLSILRPLTARLCRRRSNPRANDWPIALPLYRSNALVAPHHLAQARIMLDAKRLMDGDEFDRLVGQCPSSTFGVELTRRRAQKKSVADRDRPVAGASA